MALASSVCRVCLAGNIMMLYIDNLELLQLFEKLTNSKLYTESDAGMPNTICYVCHRQLQRCHMFVDMARRSDKTMRDMLDNGIEVTYSMITMLSLVTTPTLSVAPTQNYTVAGYSNTSSTPATVKEEQIAVKIEEKTLTAETDMEIHTPDKHTEAVDSSKELNEVEGGGNEVEVEGNEVEGNEVEVEGNKVEVNGKKVEVDGNKVDGNKLEVDGNKVEVDGNKVEVDGNKEEKTTIVKSATKKRSSKLSDKQSKGFTRRKIYRCDNCDKIFNHKARWRKHSLTHSRTPRTPKHSCSICNEKFGALLALQVHMRLHTGETLYTCDICDKQITNKYSFQEHMHLHTGKKPHACTICPKKFALRTYFIRHMKRHNNTTYSCILCRKEYTSKYNLKMHMNIHTGERPEKKKKIKNKEKSQKKRNE